MRSIGFGLGLLIALTAAGAGCEWAASVDRSQIPEPSNSTSGTGGAMTGGSGATSSSGGTTSSTGGATTGTGGATGGGGATTGTGGATGGGGATTGAGGVTGGSGGGTGGSGGGSACQTPDQCPGQDSECAQRTCVAGVCGIHYTTTGTATTSQTSGDCKERQCDGMGGVVMVALSTDVFNDGTACTTDTCNGQTPVNTAAAAGSLCTENGGKMCDGAGKCVECVLPSDCTSGVCQANACAPASCADMIKNGTETDIDCGGSCGPCGDGKTCGVSTDCVSLVCSGGLCQTPTCSDSKLNGVETDVDCGGTCTTKCAFGKGCVVNADCVGGLCSGTTCLATCTDGVKNGGETDVDCGGGACPTCGSLKACVSNGDCASNLCGGGLCQPCNDGVKDGSESDIDCGGPYCQACQAGQHCSTSADCAGNDVCNVGKCCGAASSYKAAVLASNPSAYWGFDETAGTTAFDSSPNGHDGTYKNGVTLGVAGAIPGESAARLDGTDDYVDFGDILGFEAQAPFSVEFFIRTSAAATVYTGIVSKAWTDLGSTRYGWLTFFNAVTTQLNVERWSPQEGIAATKPLSLNQWTHVVVTYDPASPDDPTTPVVNSGGPKLMWWINGAFDRSNWSVDSIVVSPGHLLVGALMDVAGVNSFTNADIDEVAIYSYRLEGTTIAAHYAAAACP